MTRTALCLLLLPFCTLADDAELWLVELEHNDAERRGEPADAPETQGRAEMLEERLGGDVIDDDSEDTTR